MTVLKTTADTPSSAMTQQPPRRSRWRGRRWPLNMLLLVISLITVTPFFLMVILALSPADSAGIPQQLPERLTLDNISRMLGASGFIRWTINTIIYSVVSVVIVLLAAAMAGYAFARKRFPGRQVLMWSFLATLMVPVQAMIIPYFVLISNLEGVNTYWGLIVPTLANAQAVFLMRQFIRDLPEELFEAAKVDGAPEWRVFFQLVLPLTKPVLATLGIFVFLWHWNDFLWPLVVAQSDDMRTLTVGLATLRTADVSTPELMAGATISVIPCIIVFFVLQRYLVNSIAMTGIK
ncbi:carbohydrate ABC transporter permease [Actinobacteria bacterium YIM 96077]|uniref:Carbohydrate ABC transporter permease n=1 Tax=Phytoactinopolyspora halophila TaxID=1981511 RepID=A0A329R1U0_9ACTN|nr:carbohydrate ABC transporter permease [Phytoactinopolyspora halophila]AYY11638.1 carbohydrate ABC transporter permease [Actinobacteria bacterium YIM 96077]RAW17929.1 carbohydrate ABC transporter permease [Phytoactinopolyspora halophila]